MKNIFVVLLISFFVVAAEADKKVLLNKIVASVGSSEVVLLSDLNGFESRLDKQGALDETLLLGESVGTLRENKRGQLNYLIREKIIETEIKRLGLSVSNAQVEAEVGQMAKRSGLDSEQFGQQLANQGFTMDEYKSILKSRIERQGLFEREIISKLRITDEDAYGVYQAQNPNNRPTVGEFTVAQIFFSNRKSGANEALARAEAALRRYKSGEKFEVLANQVDETPGANPGGFLGAFKSGEFIPQLENAVVRLNEGEVSGVLRGPNGFHIIKLISKKTVPDPNFLKVKEQIKSRLVQQNFERQLKNWFELKKSDSAIKIYDEVLQKSE
jgi:peptidyl-prolyl cis-trans isomerase SurA